VALVWVLAFGALVLLLAFLVLIFFLVFWGGSGGEVCIKEDLVRDFPRHSAELNELRELVLTLNGKTPIRGLWQNSAEPNSDPFVISSNRIGDDLRLSVAIQTRFAGQRTDLLRMKRLMDSLGLHAANVSDGDFFMAWLDRCAYVHVGARSTDPGHWRFGHQRIPGEEKWFAIRD